MKRSSAAWVLLLGVWIGSPCAAQTINLDYEGTDLVPFGSAYSFHKPINELDDPSFQDPDWSANWFKSDFNTQSPIRWQEPSPAPFAYGDPPDPPPAGCEADRTLFHPDPTAANMFCNGPDGHILAFTEASEDYFRPVGTFLVQPPVNERYSTYFRHDFTTTESRSNLAIEFLVDDAAVFYLDGEEVASFNCCAGGHETGQEVFYTDLAAGGGPETGYFFDALPDDLVLAPGDHTLAVVVLQSDIASSDMGFSMSLFDGFAPEVVEPIFAAGETWSYLKGTQEPGGGAFDSSLGWTTTQFDDSGWETGQDGFGYENSAEVGVGNFVNTVLSDMRGRYSSLYLRKEFDVSDPDVETLRLQLDYDDSFIAYINGVEVARSHANLSDPPTFDSFGVSHESSNSDDPAAFSEGNIDMTQFPGLLSADGDNVLALHVLNSSLLSSDFAIGKLSLFGVDPGSGLPDPCRAPSACGRPLVPGDYDADGQLTAADINLLAAAIQDGLVGAEFDLDGNGSVDTVDHTFWVSDLRNTWLGDSNLDGVFDTGDLVAVFQVGHYEDGVPGNSDWTTGDWNGDSEFDTGDLVAAFQMGGFEQGLRPVTPVPEPSSLTVLLLFGAGFFRRRISVVAS